MAAHPEHVYAAVYESRGSAPPRVVREPALVARDAFLAQVAQGDLIVEMPPEQAWASDIGRVAARRASAGAIGSEADLLEPLYLQAPSPERR